MQRVLCPNARPEAPHPSRWLAAPRLVLLGILVFSLLVPWGCVKEKLIPETKIPDTTLNREILGVIERYRLAMESLDAAAVLSLVHQAYQDTSGTPEGNDDLDYNGLKNVLITRFKNTTKIRYRIEYQYLRIKGQEAEVDAYIDATFAYEDPKANPRWRRLTDFNRFHLVKEGNRWLFTTGL
jgi:hypothetical protein